MSLHHAAISPSVVLHHFNHQSPPKPTASPSFFNSPKLKKKSHKIHQSTSCSFNHMNQMEVEVKLRLPNASAHQKVLSLLSPFKTATHNQRNTFFDGSSNELSSRRAILRLRFYETPTGKPKCVICLKAKAVIIDGVSRVEEDEEEVDSTIAYECVEEPDRILGFDSRIVRRVKEEFGVKGFLGLGGFRNVRNVCEWNGVKLEVDETVYDFGTCYEIECESEEPEKVKGMIEDFLKENEVEYSYSEKSKFAIFRSGKLP